MNRRQQGLTLIELMVTLAVAIVLLAIGIPAFQGIEANSRAVAQANSLVTALSLARSEAVSRGIPVAVCARATDTSCGGSGVWAAGGWLVFTDAYSTGGSCDDCDLPPDSALVTTRDQVVKVFGAPGRPPTLTTKRPCTSGGAAFAFVRFNSRGEQIDANGQSVEGCVQLQQTGATSGQVRCVRIARSGQVVTERVACP